MSRALLLIALAASVVLGATASREPFMPRLVRAEAAAALPEMAALLDGEPVAVSAVLLEYAQDPVLRLGAHHALLRHPEMARAILPVYGGEPEFREVLREHGPAVMPPIAYFMTHEIGTLSIMHAAGVALADAKRVALQFLGGAGDAAPDAGHPARNAGNAAPDARHAARNAGNAAPDAGNPTRNAGNAAPDAGNPARNARDAAPDAGNAARNARDAAPDAGNPARNAGAAGPKAGDAAPGAGAAARGAGDAARNAGDAAPDAAAAQGADAAGDLTPVDRGWYAIAFIRDEGHDFLGQFAVRDDGEVAWVQTERITEAATAFFTSGVRTLETRYRLDQDPGVSDVLWAGVDLALAAGALKVLRLGRAAGSGAEAAGAATARTSLAARTLVRAGRGALRIGKYAAPLAVGYAIVRHPSLVSALGAQVAGLMGWPVPLVQGIVWFLVLLPLLALARLCLRWLVRPALAGLRAATRGVAWLERRTRPPRRAGASTSEPGDRVAPRLGELPRAEHGAVKALAGDAPRTTGGEPVAGAMQGRGR